MTSSPQVEFEQAEYYLKAILEQTCYIESRLDEAQGKSSDMFRHIQQGLIDFDGDLGGAVQFEKNFNSLFESFSKNPLLQGLSSAEKLSEFKIMAKAAQMDTFEQVPQAVLERTVFLLISFLFMYTRYHRCRKTQGIFLRLCELFLLMIFQTSVLFHELARRLRSMLRKALIFNDLRRAAGRGRVSA
jgi:hypothetical protein